VLTAGGELRLSRRYHWNKGKLSVCPADVALGIDEQRTSPGARQMCCLMGIHENFRQAVMDLKKLAGLSVSKEKLREVVEAQASQVRQVRDSGALPASWSASEAKLPDGKARVYVGVDGVMAPTVTQAEKDKRRQQHVTRRQQRGKAGLDNARALPPPKAGTDEKFKEMKIGVFYDQAKERRHVFATEETSKDFAPLLATHARLIGLENAQETLGRVDGAVWIYQQVCLALVSISSILLDFYHLAEHVHAAARCCLGEGTTGASAWAGALLQQAKESNLAGMLGSIKELEKRMRSKKKKESLRGLQYYIEQRRDMLDYAQALRQGQDIGSGPTEAECKTLTMRLKGPGMKWDRDHAAGMMNLIALRESGQWDPYWLRQAA
jgi:ribosomal protein S15P/S13E